MSRHSVEVEVGEDEDGRGVDGRGEDGRGVDGQGEDGQGAGHGVIGGLCAWEAARLGGNRQNGGVAREESITTRLTVETYAPEVTPPRSATMPWWMAAVGGAVVCLVASWAVGAALVLIAQLAQTGAVTGPALRLATQLWLLAHGGVLESSGVRITLVPLGFTILVALSLHGVTGYAGRQARLAGGDDFHPAPAVGLIALVVAATYGMAVAVVAVVIGTSLRAGLGAAALALVMSFFGARKTTRWDCYAAWPLWARALPRAVGAAVAVAVLGGITALVTGLIVHWSQFVTLTEQLQPGWGGGVILVFLQLFFIINIIVWGTSYTFGPGFTLGDGSVVSLVGSQVGLLPALPVTAALPSGIPSLWNIAWLAFPVLAGVAAAIVVLKARPRARFDETALVGGLAGVLSGVVVTGLAAITRGDLGVARLTGLGPILLPLLVIAPSLMGLGGMLTGFVAGLVRRPTEPADPRWWSRWLPAGQAEPPPSLPEETASTVFLPRSKAVVKPSPRLTDSSQPVRQEEPSPVSQQEPTPKLSSVRGLLGRLSKRRTDSEQMVDGESTTINVLADTEESTPLVTGAPAAAKKPRTEEQPALDFYAD